MNRAALLHQCCSRPQPWDLLVIGGGAAGAAVAMDAASRGLDVVLLEAGDFGQGTSSRSTKLAHGGVRYLRQGQFGLVRSALRERGYLLRNAPHLVQRLAFVVPVYGCGEGVWYYSGLKLYDWLAGRLGLGPARWLSVAETLARLPTLQCRGLRGGVLFADAQFDDARLALAMVQTAVEHGACAVNYAPVVNLLKDAGGRVCGVQFRDAETGQTGLVPARCVVNTAGPFIEVVRKWAGGGERPLVTLSRGSHVVLSLEFMPTDTALLVPRTEDGRVLFLIPWQGRLLAGTTDVEVDAPAIEPRPSAAEVEFILRTAAQYLETGPGKEDVLSAFAGLRALASSGKPGKTGQMPRDHRVELTVPGLITLAGGKWTTCRQMAEDCVDAALEAGGWGWRPCVTQELALHGSLADAQRYAGLAVYGSDAPRILELAGQLGDVETPWGEDVPVTPAQVIWAVREEMARTVADVLARRTRLLFLDARAAGRLAPAVARLMAAELGRPGDWVERQVSDFQRLAADYLPGPSESG